jgi:hypothetical protein
MLGSNKTHTPATILAYAVPLRNLRTAASSARETSLAMHTMARTVKGCEAQVAALEESEAWSDLADALERRIKAAELFLQSL